MSQTTRREALKLLGAGAAGLIAGFPAMAGPFTAEDFARLVPADKKLSAEWLGSLTARGAPTVYRGAELETIGLPIGGLTCGQLYLGGDGRLWLWDIFNLERGTGAEHYARPLKPDSPFDQGFALRLRFAGTTQHRPLDRRGFAEIAFHGEYPMARIEYRDGASPVAVELEAFSPFVPLDLAASSLPATVLTYTLRNTSTVPVDVDVVGWLQNPVCLGTLSGVRHNRVTRRDGYLAVEALAEPLPPPTSPPTVFADFEGEGYGAWVAEGEAFGTGPGHGPLGIQQLHGWQGKGLVNTWQNSDAPTGRLTSPEFTLERPFISFLIGGGDHPGETCINLCVDGKVVRTATGKNSDQMAWAHWDVSDLKGKRATLEILDRASGGWGHIDLDQIEFGDRPRSGTDKLEEQPDSGTLALALLGPAAGAAAEPSVPEGERPACLFAGDALARDPATSKPHGANLAGAVVQPLHLAPGQGATVRFAVAWHFPNARVGGLSGRHYGTRFSSAGVVLDHLVAELPRLAAETRRWRDTWYDSTLPYWLLDRAMANTSTLATNTSYRLGAEPGRFWGWEGVGCCAGTCTHVWHYAQAAGRLFPELERRQREDVDFGVALDPATGIIGFRGNPPAAAVDGQAGTILRAYREHQMAPDDAYLRRTWPGIRKAVEWLIAQDGNDDGLLEGRQHNTLDADWYGPVAWLSSLYLAALAAAAAMADEAGDPAFAVRCRGIVAKGQVKLVETLWNGEYFIHRPDPAHPEAMRSADGCEIDQVFGQHWAWMVGLGRLLDGEKVRAALQALWRHNFTPDVGPYRKTFTGGRWYAMPGEAGTLMCTFPKGPDPYLHGGGVEGKLRGFAGYFNECMNGFEHQVAGHMLWEGLVTEGLAVCRAVHDRYHAARRNPWNEVECGDHYARSMASYGVFLAACGYEHHGPRGHLGFAPRLTPEDFRAPFTAAEGWGTYRQRRGERTQQAEVELRWGRLRLRTLALAVPAEWRPARVTAELAGTPAPASLAVEGTRVTVSFAPEVVVGSGQRLVVRLA